MGRGGAWASKTWSVCQNSSPIIEGSANSMKFLIGLFSKFIFCSHDFHEQFSSGFYHRVLMHAIVFLAQKLYSMLFSSFTLSLFRWTLFAANIKSKHRKFMKSCVASPCHYSMITTHPVCNWQWWVITFHPCKIMFLVPTYKLDE